MFVLWWGGCGGRENLIPSKMLRFYLADFINLWVPIKNKTKQKNPNINNAKLSFANSRPYQPLESQLKLSGSPCWLLTCSRRLLLTVHVVRCHKASSFSPALALFAGQGCCHLMSTLQFLPSTPDSIQHLCFLLNTCWLHLIPIGRAMILIISVCRGYISPFTGWFDFIYWSP